MYLDALLRVANAQTFNGASEVSADSVDLGVTPASGVPGRRVGTGEPLELVFFVETAAAATGAGTAEYLIEAISAADAALTSSPTQLAAVTRTEAQLVAGAVVRVPIPPGTPTQRYIGGRIDLPLSASTVVGSMFIGPRDFVDQWIAYRRGYTV
jgi:hypothetical protein